MGQKKRTTGLEGLPPENWWFLANTVSDKCEEDAAKGDTWEETCCPNRENHPTPFTYVLYPIKGARKGARAAISLRALIEEVERLYKGYLRPPVYTTRPPVGPGQAQFVMADKRRRVRRLVRPQSNFLQLIKTSSSSKGAVYKLLSLHLSLIPLHNFWQIHN